MSACSQQLQNCYCTMDRSNLLPFSSFGLAVIEGIKLTLCKQLHHMEPQLQLYRSQHLGEATANNSLLPSVTSAVDFGCSILARLLCLKGAGREVYGKPDHRKHGQLLLYSCHIKASSHGWDPKRMQEPNLCSRLFNCPDGYHRMAQRASHLFLHGFSFPKLTQDSNYIERKLMMYQMLLYNIHPLFLSYTGNPFAKNNFNILDADFQSQTACPELTAPQSTFQSLGTRSNWRGNNWAVATEPGSANPSQDPTTNWCYNECTSTKRRAAF